MKNKQGSIFLAAVLFLTSSFFCPRLSPAEDKKEEGSPELRPAIEYEIGGLRDPFESYIKEKPAGQRQSLERPAFDTANFNLQGVISGGDNPCVIINHKVLKIGSLINEAMVKKIEKQGVTLSYQEQDYFLLAPAEAGPELIKKQAQRRPYD